MTKPQHRDQPGPGIPGKIEHFIGGRHVPSADGATFNVAAPVTNTVYAQAAAGGAADIDRAVAAAREAFQAGPGRAWRREPARRSSTGSRTGSRHAASR